MQQLSKKEIINDAAVKIFARRGFHGTRITDIVEEADVAYGLIYHYFRNKEEILLHIFRTGWQNLLDKLDQLDDKYEDPMEKLMAIVDYNFAIFSRNRDLMKVLIMDVPRLDQFYQKENFQLYHSYFVKISRIIDEGQRNGVISEKSAPMNLSYLFHGAIDGIIRQFVYNASSGGVKERLDSVKNEAKAFITNSMK